MRILVAEDDSPLAEFLHQRLVQEQFAVQTVSTGIEAQRLAVEQAYDLVLLDLSGPEGISTLEVLRHIRAKKPDLPVFIVTAASMVEERVRGLDAGADDYIAKPFAFAELAARIRAVLRRGRPGNAVLAIDDLVVDRISHAVQRGGHAIDLSPKEFALLEYLMRHAGQPVTRSAIVEQVWKLNFDTMTNVVDVYINYLRRKVDTGYDRALIRTVRGVGYQIGGSAGAARSAVAGLAVPV
jgi:two-component system copper resistance phosphate regulon response regulator CusR